MQSVTIIAIALACVFACSTIALAVVLGTRRPAAVVETREPRIECAPEPRESREIATETRHESWTEPQALGRRPPLSIVTATYWRSNGRSIEYLKRAGECVRLQSYQNWRWFIVGDHYAHPDSGDAEVRHLVTQWNDERIMFVNMPEPGERGRVPPERLWQVAGATAMNTGIQISLEHGGDWCVHLDDDDVWRTDHLESIADGILSNPEALIVYTQAQFSTTPFPASDHVDVTGEQPPMPERAVHSSIAFDAYRSNNRYRTDIDMPADANLIAQFAGVPSVFVPNVTVHHVEEGSNSLCGFLIQKLYIGVDGIAPAGWLALMLGTNVQCTAGSTLTRWDLLSDTFPLKNDSVLQIVVDDAALDAFEDSQIDRIVQGLSELLQPNATLLLSTRRLACVKGAGQIEAPLNEYAFRKAAHSARDFSWFKLVRQ